MSSLANFRAHHKKLHQLEVAKRLGMTGYSFDKIERGQHELSDAIAEALATIYEVPVEVLWLLYWPTRREWLANPKSRGIQGL